MRHYLAYFTKTERLLWSGSTLAILAAYLLFDGSDHLTLAASLIGTTSLIFCARGNPIGQVLMIVFSLLYGYISYTFSYYGEMITYLGMSLPLAVIALVTWLRHPFAGNHAEVEIRHLAPKEVLWGLAGTVAVTFVFFFVLRYMDTANLLPSTLSIATSFFAVYLTLRRSPWYGLAYAANDLVLVLLWVLASMVDRSYIAVTVCFLVFFINDLYAFRSWRRIRRRQEAHIR